MREILFRGKRIFDEEWIYGNLVIDKNGCKHIIPMDQIEEDGHHLLIDSDLPVFIMQETVGQFTGLFDTNGVKIFEGDICTYSTPEYKDSGIEYKSRHETGTVTIKTNGVNFSGWQISSPLGGCVRDYKITGNIHETEK